MSACAAYLGAVIAARAHWHSLIGIVVCWVAMMAPGIMLIYGLLPFWGQFRSNQMYRRALPGLMAAAVGLVVFAVFRMYDTFTCAAAPLLDLMHCKQAVWARRASAQGKLQVILVVCGTTLHVSAPKLVAVATHGASHFSIEDAILRYFALPCTASYGPVSVNPRLNGQIFRRVLVQKVVAVSKNQRSHRHPWLLLCRRHAARAAIGCGLRRSARRSSTLAELPMKLRSWHTRWARARTGDGANVERSAAVRLHTRAT